MARLSLGEVAESVDNIPLSHSVCIELKNRASLLTKERSVELESNFGGQVLIRDWKHTFEELLGNPVQMSLKTQFPIFFWALSITTDWKYRLLSLLTFCWFIIGFYATTMQNPCLRDPKVFMTISTTPFLMLCTTVNTLANPWLFTGSVNGSMTTGKLSKGDPAASGYFRLLEAQLSLIRTLGLGHGDAKGSGMPVEGMGFKAVLRLFPLGIIVLCILVLISTQVFWGYFESWMSEGLGENGSDCSIPDSLRYSTGFLMAPFFNAILSVYACIVSLCGLSVGSTVCGSMTASWCARYESAKYLTESGLPTGIRKHDIRSDAYERYFLIRQFLAQSSSTWNNYLVIYMLAFFVVFFYSTVTLFLDSHPSSVGSTQMLWQLLSLVAFVSPLYIVSTANASSRQMENMFRYSTPSHIPPGQTPDWIPSAIPYPSTNSNSNSNTNSNTNSNSAASFDSGVADRYMAEKFSGNFSIIGGRSEWLNFIKDAPLYWTVLSQPVTFERLTTFVLGTAVSLIATTLPRLLSRLTPS